MCFGTRNNQFGSFRYNGQSRVVGALMLVHRQGLVKCWNAYRGFSRWGCLGVRVGGQSNVLNVVVTDGMNHLIFPKQESIVHKRGLWYIIPGVHELHSQKLVFTDFARPFYLQKHMHLRVWYGEDLKGHTEGDNHGRACVDVYASFL